MSRALNTDEDFYADPAIVEAFLAAVIATHAASVDFTDAMLSGQNRSTILHLLRQLDFRGWLAHEADPPPSNRSI